MNINPRQHVDMGCRIWLLLNATPGCELSCWSM